MSLSAGTRLGPYEVVALLGAGGMGEVYRARDTKLQRDVALKVLPHVLRNDPDRLARFEREARLLASLNHPNIAAIHQILESGGISALVLELVEGLTLADRLTQGALQQEEALGIARQIVSALQAAHDVGVVHRDLKPANVKLRPDGTVKVLDFGLAKALEAPPGAAADSESPTRTCSAMTQDGHVLGTAAYMSPERARGLPADQRADIWAFGCVLYEMLSGRRAFAGDHWSDIFAGVLEREPDFSRLPPGTPHSVRRLLRWCLEKDLRRRLHSIADARLDLEEESATNSDRQTSREKLPARRARSAVWAISGLLAGGLMVFMTMRLASPTVSGTVTFAFSPPPNVELRDPMALSPDGRTLVYTGIDDRGSRLYKRALDALDSVPIRGTEGGGFPFFSPDGAWVGFSDGQSIKKVPVQGGTAETVCEISGELRATWLSDDSIVFGSTSGLMRVGAAGGEVSQLTIVDRAHGEIEHHSPVNIPGADALLFTVYSGARDGQRIEVVSLDSRTRTPLVPGSGAQYLGSEHIVFAFEHTGSLWVAPFDRKRLTMTGPPAPMLEGILISDHWIPNIAVGASGSLAYAKGTATSQYSPRRLVWVDSTGREEPVDAPVGAWWWPEISPDGKRLGLHKMDPVNMDAWIYELDHGPLRQMTLHPAQDGYPLWSRDGTRIAFWSRQGGVASNLYLRSADLTGDDEQLTNSPNAQAPFSWTRDNRLVFQEFSPDTRTDIGVVSIDGTRTPTLIIREPFDEGRPSISPDGAWIAYQANDSGRFEVYVQPFPELGERHRVSTEGGASPLWHPNGRELVYRKDRMMISVPITTTARIFGYGNPRTVFERSYVMEGSDVGGGRNYALAPDGRFLMMKEEKGLEGGSGPTEIVVILNWTEEVKRRLTPEADRAR